MKVLAINSSPNMEKGITGFILNLFLEGMKEKGAEVEIFYTKKLNIKPCTACFNCWFLTEGECSIKDDMETGKILYNTGPNWNTDDEEFIKFMGKKIVLKLG